MAHFVALSSSERVFRERLASPGTNQKGPTNAINGDQRSRSPGNTTEERDSKRHKRKRKHKQQKDEGAFTLSIGEG
jgi:hypothetical protein